MAIIGIETVRYCVEDVALCTRYFDDFGLPLDERGPDRATFLLPDNSKVILQSLADVPVEGSRLAGPGVHEVIWGVDTRSSFDRLVAGLSADRDVRIDDAGTAHFVCDDGLAMGLKVWDDHREVRTATDPVNSPGNIRRMNTHRKWIARARPKYIQHVVFMSPDVEASFVFMRDRLGFRMSDHQRLLGIFARADGTTDHHNIYFLNANAPFPGADGRLRFHHVNYAVTDLDEIMVGKNYMERKGWDRSIWGVGRHRIASSLFLYLPAPTGGEAEYGADSDAIDDNWIPRSWEPLFGIAHWMHEMPAFWSQGADWDVGFVASLAPSRGSVAPDDPTLSLPVAQGRHPDDAETGQASTLPRELRNAAR
ncbi:VOC family protein [Sphingomonas sp. CGMCC 1.13654]|uniref:VOC family protein n=1 Tax=Sphingomonas chungangi TaxID=2683589 RepID=A0A838L7G5_9SPHN|nr:VOC family protein [Sphingomonas chungangi]MBA2933498.1 VOC family protein [Sphingomonas chungangi]MVW54831.1 glyoxalase [Sphingomonas chungangi]